MHWLASRKPDIVGLQELKMQDEQFPHEVFKEAGYHAQVFGQKSWNGVAVLSREPAELLHRGLEGGEEMGSRLISVRCNGIGFTTVYCPNGKSVSHEDYGRKLAWYDRLIEFSKRGRESGELDVLCGDFNIVPAAIDTHKEDPESIFHTDEERARLAALMETGLTDLYREMHPESTMFSWWDYRGGSFYRNLGLRIDFILTADHLKGRAQAIEIDRDYRKKKDGLTASDHAPVMLDLEDE